MSSAYLSLLIFLPICQEQVNFYLWLCSAILGLLYLCRLWVSPAGSDGLWQVQGHQQPLILCSQYVGRVCSLLMAGVFLVGITVSQIHTALAFHLCFCGSNVINHFFLWFTPVFVFFPCPAQKHRSLSWWYSLLWILLNWALFQESLLLFLYHAFNLEDPLCWGESQSFYHLHLPLNCSVNFPGTCALYVFQAKFILLSRWRQNYFFVLHSCDSPAKSSNI